VAEPWSEKRAALRLNLSEHTVRNYMIRIFDKLGISSRVELVLYAFSSTEGFSGLDSGTHLASAFDATAEQYCPSVSSRGSCLST
jgi:Bacterial regulatory proteins, luxR family